MKQSFLMMGVYLNEKSPSSSSKWSYNKALDEEARLHQTLNLSPPLALASESPELW